MKNKLLLLIIILIISVFVRTLFLDRVPGGINDDELHFVLNAKSTYYAFTNIEANINSFKLGEISSLIFAPVIGPFTTSLFVARLPYAIIGCFSILLIYLLVVRLTSNYRLALLSAAVASINPWSIYVSRTSFDAPIAIFFFLLTIYLLTFPRLKYLVLSTLTGYLAFNAYIGTKILYFPSIIFSSYFLWTNNHKRRRKISRDG